MPTNPGFFDYGTEVALGRMAGRKIIKKFGRNPDIGTTEADIRPQGGVYPWATTPFGLDAVSTSADDTVGGAGVNSVNVQGLDPNFDEIEIEIPVNGLARTTAVTPLFIRTNRCFNGACGTYSTTTDGGNFGTVLVRRIGEPIIEVGIVNEDGIPQGQSQVGRFTVPRGFQLLVYAVYFWIDSGKAATISMWQRQGANIITAPFTSKRLVNKYDGINQSEQINFKTPKIFPEFTDIWFSAFVPMTSASISIDMEIMMIKNAF